MRFFTKEWFQLCQDCSNTWDLQNPEIKEPIENYVAILKEQHIPETLLQKLDFHDSELLEIQYGDNVMILQMEDRGDGWYQRIKLRHPQVQKLECPIVGCQWVYDEIYRIEGSYELHVLFQAWGKEKSLELTELIVQCSEIDIE